MTKDKETAVRICRWDTIDEAFSGKGSRLKAGRWYGTGTEIVPAANSTALAILEVLNYINNQQDLMGAFWLYEITFPSEMVKIPDLKDLGEKWRDPLYNPETRSIGDACYIKNQAAVLSVPSAVIGTTDPKTDTFVTLDINGHNYLLFPKHPHFSKIKIRGPYKLHLDQRLTNQLAAHDVLVETLRKEASKRRRSR